MTRFMNNNTKTQLPATNNKNGKDESDGVWNERSEAERACDQEPIIGNKKPSARRAFLGHVDQLLLS